MKRTKTQKGITLIALIITIVILLILAVVAINSITNTDLIAHADNSSKTYNNSVTNEQTILGGYQNYLKNYINGEVEEPDDPEEDEELTEEDLAEIELMERYILGPTGQGRLGLEIANVNMETMQITSFMDDTSTEGIDESKASPLFTAWGASNLESSTVCFKYNNKVYKVLINPTTFFTESIEMIYKPLGREGQEIEGGTYDGWIILTDRDGLVEIVSPDVMKDENGEALKLTLGSGDTSVTVTKDLDGDETFENDSDDVAILSYNNAITTINNYCKEVMGMENVRSVGGTNNSATTYSSTNYDSWGSNIKTEVVSGDTQYEKDMAKLYYHQIANVGVDYWLASRLVREFSSDVYFELRCVSEGMLDNLILWLVDSDGRVNDCNNPSGAVRPVVINPSGI